MTNQGSKDGHVVAWVDDDADYRALVRQWLEPRYVVREFATGQDFLTGLEDCAPDAILMDVGLPDIDGFSLCRKVRESGLDAPMLFLTSSNDQDDYLKHVELGATGYLMKPVGRRQLLSRLAQIVDGERLSEAPRWKEAAGWVPGLSARRAKEGAPGLKWSREEVSYGTQTRTFEAPAERLVRFGRAPARHASELHGAHGPLLRESVGTVGAFVPGVRAEDRARAAAQ